MKEFMSYDRTWKQKSRDYFVNIDYTYKMQKKLRNFKIKRKEDDNHIPLFSGDPCITFSGDPCIIFSGDPSIIFSGDPCITFSGDPCMTFSGDPCIIFSGDPCITFS